MKKGCKRALPPTRCGVKPESTAIPRESARLLLAALTAWEKREGRYVLTQWDLAKARRLIVKPNGV